MLIIDNYGFSFNWQNAILNYMVKFKDVFSKADWVKIGILLVAAIICVVWVYREYQKPIIPPEWEQELTRAQ